MQINAALNLVFPIRSEQIVKPNSDPKIPGKTIVVETPILWAYHTPISTEIFAANYRIIAAAKATIFAKGTAYAADAGPRIAALALRDAGTADARELGSDDTAPALLAEIRRLTHILAPGTNGYEMIPIDVATARNVIAREEWDEAESFLVFFTLGYSMALRLNRQAMGDALALVLAGSMTSSLPMEFAASLMTSTPAAITDQAAQS